LVVQSPLTGFSLPGSQQAVAIVSGQLCSRGTLSLAWKARPAAAIFVLHQRLLI
jgi:hypothetical protein